MSFSNEQVRMLKAAVPRRHVRERQAEGKTLHYLEGWRVVSQANRIFGFDSWDRETVSSECVWRAPVGDRFAAAYLTRVRISVRAGDRVVVREGLGSGEAIAASPGQAHEWASKAAETDATKRALSTFGASFGLLLYGERSEAKPVPKMDSLGGAAARVVNNVSKAMRDRAKPSPRMEDARFSDTGWKAVGRDHPFRREPRAMTAAEGSPTKDPEPSQDAQPPLDLVLEIACGILRHARRVDHHFKIRANRSSRANNSSSESGGGDAGVGRPQVPADDAARGFVRLAAGARRRPRMKFSTRCARIGSLTVLAEARHAALTASLQTSIFPAHMFFENA